MVTVVITSEQQLEESFRQLLHGSVNLRFWTKEWNKDNSVTARDNMRRWEKRVDDLLESMQVQKSDKAENIRIVQHS